MKIYYQLFIIALSATVFASCSDFLEREPLSQGTEAIFFKNPEQFKQAANALYNLEGWKNYDNSNIGADRLDRGLDISGFDRNGGGSAGEGDWRWDRPYGYIRNCNILLEKAAEYTGNQEDIKASVGAAYFFRAWQHFYLLQRFGGVPVSDHVMDVNDAVIYGPRNSRYEVANLIINDLRVAIPMLPGERDIAAVDKGKVSREAAKAFLARVLLFEATWEKYTPGIGFDLDGDGVSTGAGTAKPSDYPSIADMLTEAKKWAGEVITEAETGTFALWNEADSLSYYYLFNLDDKGGNRCNPYGKGKATNKEYIFSVKYDSDIRRPAFNLGHTVITNQLTGVSSIFADMFLCRNGLPIYISTDGVTREKNPDFPGFEGFYDEFRNRDYRFIGSIRMPDRACWSNRPEYGDAPDGINPYPQPVYPTRDPYLGEPMNPSDPAYASHNAITTPIIGPNSTHNGYGCRKFNPEGTRADQQESPDYPLIRLAEVHLIYAEATVELGNGQISDQDLNFSINKNRARARVAPLTNTLIADKYDAGWWDHEQNKTVIKKMNMLDEIRRERACELFGEGFRESDLKRWGVAHINLRGQKLGQRIYNTAYMTGLGNSSNYYGEKSYDPETRPLLYGIYEGSGPDDLDYGRSIATLPDNLLYSQRDYLAPIPLGQIRLNEVLVQNPGW
ncbi:MAG: RagB/SusD family nutrient uptake outer membrane protein [Tannerella sp.]|jgi:hypothetical protein|nr:RagB/SusD family nutrient uptake outer membrane protein [Tannerella sp.]